MEFSSSKQYFSLLFVMFSLISHMNLSSVHAATIPSTTTQFIKTSCSSTTYPKLCYTSLSIHASSIQTSPRLLAATALTVSLSAVKSTTSQVLKLSQSHGVSPMDESAIRDCLEELTDSVDSLKSSIGEMNKLRGSGYDLAMNNIQTWVSAALTDETTCSDGFQDVKGGVKAVVRSRIVNVAQLTSNALSLINRMAELHR